MSGRIETIKDGGEQVGNRVRVKVAKNKMAPPFRQAEFDIMFGEGISREGSLLDVAVDHGVVRKSGAWFTFEQDQLGQGRENAKRFIRENPEIAMQLQAKIYELVDPEPVEEDRNRPRWRQKPRRRSRSRSKTDRSQADLRAPSRMTSHTHERTALRTETKQ